MATVSRGLFIDEQSNFIRFPDYVEGVVLVANTAKAVAVPVDPNGTLRASMCLFSGFNNIDFYVRYNPTAAGGAAVVPVNTTDGTSNEANPVGRFLGKGAIAELSLIAASNCVGTILFWF